MPTGPLRPQNAGSIDARFVYDGRVEAPTPKPIVHGDSRSSDMRRVLMGSFALMALTCSGVPVASASSISKAAKTLEVVSVGHTGGSLGDTAEPPQKGRYKADGEACVWDANDSGPDQCTPQTVGRFKKSRDSCTWDPKDKGPDQCTPRQGRWKTDGDRCVWDANDSGPNQCNPRRPRRRAQ